MILQNAVMVNLRRLFIVFRLGNIRIKGLDFRSEEDTLGEIPRSVTSCS